MKKIIAILLTLVLLFTLSACGQKIESITLKESEITVRVEDTYQLAYEIAPSDIENPDIKWSSSDSSIAVVDETGKITAVSEGTAEITASSGKVASVCTVKVGKKVSTETDYMKIEGLYLDNSYKDKDNESLRLLYVFYTVKTPDENLKVDSKSMKITFNDGNQYTATHIPSATKYTKYYYSSYLQEVFKGDELKVVETFEVPKGEFEDGVALSFEKSQVPQTELLAVITDDIVACDGAKEIGKKADPEGYKEFTEKMEKADAATTSKVKNLVNGYQWSFYVNSTSYELEFYAAANFQLRTIYNTVDGTYTVRNGFITLNYPSGYTVDIPYEFKDGDIQLDAADAFDVMEG